VGQGARDQSRAASASSGSSVSLEPPRVRPSGLQGRRCLPFDAPRGSADTRALKRVLVPLGQVPPHFGPEPVSSTAAVPAQAGLMVIASCSALACCRPGRRGATACSRSVRSELLVATSARC